MLVRLCPSVSVLSSARLLPAEDGWWQSRRDFIFLKASTLMNRLFAGRQPLPVNLCVFSVLALPSRWPVSAYQSSIVIEPYTLRGAVLAYIWHKGIIVTLVIV